MSLSTGFLIYVTAFRLSIITAGVVSIVLGYRLFVKGIYAAGGPESSIDFKAAGSAFTLKNAAPGTCFGFFGAILITVMLIQGSPQFTYEAMQKAGAAEGAATTSKLELRGGETPGAFASLIEKGLAYEIAGDSTRAMDTYKQALGGLATPMNQLAWLYLQRPKRMKPYRWRGWQSI